MQNQVQLLYIGTDGDCLTELYAQTPIFTRVTEVACMYHMIIMCLKYEKNLHSVGKLEVS